MNPLSASVEPHWEPDPLDRRAPAVEELAAKLASERGGQTVPLCDYDLDRAEEIVTGRKNLRAENTRLRRRVAEFEQALGSGDLDSKVSFLEEAARYFEKRPTNGEDAAHWANVYNAKNCREIAQLFAKLSSASVQLRVGG